MAVRLPLLIVALAAGLPAHREFSQVTNQYRSLPFMDACHQTGPPTIPGIVQCALYDRGSEGVAYHDSDPVNHGSGELNQEASHQRPHASPYLWNFRQDEGVDISYVKDWADLNHPNEVSPPINQLYIGWATNGEWCNYTVDVKSPGTYRIKALYSYQTNTVSFDLNGQPAAICQISQPTPGWHHWHFAEIGTIDFPQAGRQRLTFHYTWGNNFAWFEFEKKSPAEQAVDQYGGRASPSSRAVESDLP